MDRKQVEINAAEKLETAKLRIISRHNLRFWSDTLKRQFVADWAIPTAATNGTVVRYNPAFIDSLTLEEVIFLIAHEVCHIKAGHHLRRGDKHPVLWNVACDYLVNDMLQHEASQTRDKETKIKLIDGCLIDRFRS